MRVTPLGLWLDPQILEGFQKVHNYSHFCCGYEHLETQAKSQSPKFSLKFCCVKTNSTQLKVLDDVTFACFDDVNDVLQTPDVACTI